MKNTSAIIFDLGGVLLNVDFNKLSDAFKSIGINNFDEMYSQSTANPLFKNLEKGKINEQQFYNEIKACTNLSVTNEQIENAWNALLLDYRIKSLERVAALKQKFYLILLSNTNSIHLREVINIYNRTIGKGSLEMYFDKVYYSHLTGMRKPDRDIFDFVLQQHNLKASETLLIDDSIQNIEGANVAGIQTIFLEKGMRIEDLGL